MPLNITGSYVRIAHLDLGPTQILSGQILEKVWDFGVCVSDRGGGSEIS